MEELKEMIEEVKEILAQGYKQRGEDHIATFFEQVDTDSVVKLAETIILSHLEKINITDEEWASLQ